ncbi:hypothetical protein [Flavobacterium sp. UMI-01]|uniref:hypothetical protein n=1 Tax=Flavobacterium sp. UMI-01 TaxID=1441053 RepID=UPI001C7DD211|nr:hypothetical protein [Flavobacterium sp. UMI-01]GIZ08162.1 hypothetical protein FUMI01_08890 [Flavobacterium sp. UMI-01]
MIEIYRTNIIKEEDAQQMLRQLRQFFPHYKIDFDLEDCDHILRVETFEETLDNDAILRVVTDDGFYIEILSDEIPFLKV